MTKAELRDKYRLMRLNLTGMQLDVGSAAVCNTIADRFLEDVKSVHVFLPIVRNKELDLWPLIRHIWTHRSEIKVVTSVSNSVGRTMKHYLLRHDTRTELNAWQIPEPVGAKSFDPNRLNVVLVPLLAYDSTGARVGYGKGYYDKFLSDIPGAMRIGVSLFPPEEIISDAEPHDVRLDCCVYPEAVCFFGEDEA